MRFVQRKLSPRNILRKLIYHFSLGVYFFFFCGALYLETLKSVSLIVLFISNLRGSFITFQAMYSSGYSIIVFCLLKRDIQKENVVRRKYMQYLLCGKFSDDVKGTRNAHTTAAEVPIIHLRFVASFSRKLRRLSTL